MHFWEARIRSQALLDDVALLQGMVYVDLNPVRAAMASSVEDSDYTAAQQRFRALMGEEDEDAALPRLAVLRGESAEAEEQALPFTLTDYLELVDTTGRCCVAGKRGFIGETVPRLLTALHLDTDTWLARMRSDRGSAHRALGAPAALRAFAGRMKQRWLHGIAVAEALYPT